MTASLPGEVTITRRIRARLGGLGGDQLDTGGVDDRQQFLGHGLGGREESGAESGGRHDSGGERTRRLIACEPNRA